MFAFIHQTYDWLDSDNAIVLRDALAVTAALIPSVYLCARFLLTDSDKTLQLVRRPAVKTWLLFFCGVQLYLHVIKASIAMKILATVFFIIPAVIFIAKELT